jgi:hypothetical protein
VHDLQAFDERQGQQLLYDFVLWNVLVVIWGEGSRGEREERKGGVGNVQASVREKGRHQSGDALGLCLHLAQLVLVPSKVVVN